MTLSQQTARQVDDLVARVQAEGRTPSLVAGVVRDGSLVHLSTAGAEPSDGTVATSDTQYRIGSISKTLTAVLIMQLRDEGLLSLEDLLYRHLPGTPVGSAITIRQLLGHVSGLQREPDGQWWERSDGPDLETFLAALTPDKIAYPPHRGYHYSNLAYGLLGAVLHRVTGYSWFDLAAKRLLEPLGMVRTSYTEREPFARGYVVHPWYDTLREEPRTDTGAMAPAGQLWSTVDDMAKWATFLADPGTSAGQQVLSAESLTEMCAPVVLSDVDSWTTGHGLGLELCRRGDRIFVGHGGSMPGYLSHLLTHRPTGTSVILFASAYTLRGHRMSALCQDLLTLVLDAEPTRPTPWQAATATSVDGQPHELAGSWWWMGREVLAVFDPSTGELVLHPITAPAKPWRCRQESADVWRCLSGANDGEYLRVRRTPNNTPESLDIATFIHTRTP